MSLLKAIIEAQGGDVLKQVAGNFNMRPEDATKAVGSLLPALTGGMKQNIQKEDGLTGLLEALKKGNHERYLENPAQITRPETVKDGNGILGHILGSKDASRRVAAEASQKTGIDVGVLKKLLPMVAAMTMGGMSKQAKSQGGGDILGGALDSMRAGRPEASRGASGMLGKMLDADGDGSVLDDVMGFAKKFM